MSFDQTSPLATNLTVAHRFEETSGNRLSSTSSPAFISQGGTVSSALGLFGNGVRIQSGKYLSRATDTSCIFGSASFTIFLEFEVKAANNDDFSVFNIGGGVVCGWVNGSSVFQIYIFNGAFTLLQDYSQNIAPGGVFTGNPKIQCGIVVNRDDPDPNNHYVRFYRNGSYNQYAIPVGFGSITNSGTFTLGSNSSSLNVDTVIDELKVWKGRALSDTEIQSIYNSGTGNEYIPNNSSISTTTATIPTSQSTVVSIDAQNFTWTSGSNPTFTLSGTGAAGSTITYSIANTTTNASITIAAGSTAGPLTITHTASGASLSIATVVDNNSVAALPTKPTGYEVCFQGGNLNGSTVLVTSGAQHYVSAGALSLVPGNSGTHLKLLFANTTQANYTILECGLWNVVRDVSGNVTSFGTYIPIQVSASNSFTVAGGGWVLSDTITYGSITTTSSKPIFVCKIAQSGSNFNVEAGGWVGNDPVPVLTGNMQGFFYGSNPNITSSVIFQSFSNTQGNNPVPLPVTVLGEGTTPGSILQYGDSNTVQFGMSGGWDGTAFYDVPYCNMAMSGDNLNNFSPTNSTVRGRLYRYRYEFVKWFTHVCFVNGTNDIGNGQTATAYKTNITAFTTGLRANNASVKFFFVTIPPQTASAGGAWAINNQATKIVGGTDVTNTIAQVNTDLGASPSTFGINTVVDTFTGMRVSGTNFIANLIPAVSADGIHVVGNTYTAPLVRAAMIPLVVGNITGVVIDQGTSIVVNEGSTKQLTATVQGTPTPSQVVTWSITSGDGLVSPLGLFTAPSLTGVTKFTVVRATASDGVTFGEITITTPVKLYNTCIDVDIRALADGFYIFGGNPTKRKLTLLGGSLRLLPQTDSDIIFPNQPVITIVSTTATQQLSNKTVLSPLVKVNTINDPSAIIFQATAAQTGTISDWTSPTNTKYLSVTNTGQLISYRNVEIQTPTGNIVPLKVVVDLSSNSDITQWMTNTNISLAKLNSSGQIQTQGYISQDGTVGVTVTTGGATFKNGLYVGGTISSSPTGNVGFTWSVIAANQVAVINNGYFTNSLSLVTVTLPSVAVVGSVIKVAGMEVGGWKIAQPSGVTIYYGIATTSASTAGYIASSNQRDTVELVCNIANVSWTVVSSIGSLLVV